MMVPKLYPVSLTSCLYLSLLANCDSAIDLTASIRKIGSSYTLNSPLRRWRQERYGRSAKTTTTRDVRTISSGARRWDSNDDDIRTVTMRRWRWRQQNRQDRTTQVWTRLLQYQTKYWTPAKPWMRTLQYKMEQRSAIWKAYWETFNSHWRCDQHGEPYHIVSTKKLVRNLHLDF